jgi:hypothetical protein
VNEFDEWAFSEWVRRMRVTDGLEETEQEIALRLHGAAAQIGSAQTRVRASELELRDLCALCNPDCPRCRPGMDPAAQAVVIGGYRTNAKPLIAITAPSAPPPSFFARCFSRIASLIRMMLGAS